MKSYVIKGTYITEKYQYILDFEGMSMYLFKQVKLRFEGTENDKKNNGLRLL